MSQRVEQIVHDGDKDTSIVFQAGAAGGDHSMLRRNGDPDLHHGCHSWRSDGTMGLVLDCFYQPEDEDPLKDGRLKRVMEWQAENETCIQKGEYVICIHAHFSLIGEYIHQFENTFVKH